MVKRAALFAFAACLSAAAHAQYRYNTDYYFDRSDSLLREQLKNVELHVPPCVQQYHRRDYQRAYADCRFILNYFPNHPTALRTMADTCVAWRTPKCDVEVFFERAIAVNPNVAGTYTVIGIYFLRINRHDQAVASFKQALERDPTSLNAHYNLGLAYFDLKQYGLSNEHAQKAYELGAPTPGLMNMLKRAGQWKPGVLPEPETRDAAAPMTQPAEDPNK